MKEIILFHSYNYINSNYKLKNNIVYDNNNNFLFQLLNIPKDTKLYNLKINKKLMTKKLSLCVNPDYFYTTHNLKIFLKINYNYLLCCILKKTINNFDLEIIFKLLIQNFINKLNEKETLKNSICINSKYNKDLSLLFKNNNQKIDFNIIKIYNLYFNLNNKTIFYNDYDYVKINIYCGLFLYDLSYYAINELINLFLKNKDVNKILIYTKNIKIWNSKLHFFDCYKHKEEIIVTNTIKNTENIINNYFDLVIIDNIFENILDNISLNNKKVIIMCSELNNITNKKLINILNNYYNFENIIISEDLISKLLKNIMYIRNYKKKHNLQIKYNSLKYRKFNFKIYDNNDIQNLNTLNNKCNICFETIKKNTICKTKCNHYFCVNCIEKMFNKNNCINCPYCRQKLTCKNIYKLYLNYNDTPEHLFIKNIKNDSIIIADYTIINIIKKIKKEIQSKKKLIYYDKSNYSNKHYDLNSIYTIKNNIHIINNNNHNIDFFINNFFINNFLN